MLAAIAKPVGKKPVTELETAGVGNPKPSDLGKALRVKVYRKWTVTYLHLLEEQGKQSYRCHDIPVI